LGKVELGEKLTCSSCGARYYDLNKAPAECPKCGTENERPKTFRTKRADTTPKPVKKAPEPKKKEAEDDEDIEDIDDIDDIETDDDDDDDLIDDDEDLDEDDDVDSVIGAIDSDEDSDT
jgi:predicted RNA-binding Zn-ribbon protein involved in translation (DUF1610 family)